MGNRRHRSDRETTLKVDGAVASVTRGASGRGLATVRALHAEGAGVEEDASEDEAEASESDAEASDSGGTSDGESSDSSDES